MPSNKEIDKRLLRFGTGNSKLAGQGIATFSIPAGYTCPGASACLSKFDRKIGKIQDGKKTEHRCYAASLEASFRSLSKSLDDNWNKLRAARTVLGMTNLILDSLPRRGWQTIRVHAHGDFFNANYFMAWMEAARRDPERSFYAYTKSLPFWVKYKELIPPNFLLTASYGGKFDAMIEQHDLRHSKVIFHPDEANGGGIDHDDSLARNPNVKTVYLLLHGTQASGTEASAAIKRMKKEGIAYSYGKGPKSIQNTEPSKLAKAEK